MAVPAASPAARVLLDGALPAVWLCRRLHRLPVFCWTVQSRQTMEQVEREGCLVIFEGFLPAGGPVPAVPKAS